MKVISISNDRKRAQVIVDQEDWFTRKKTAVTRHATRIPGTKNKFTIWVRKGPDKTNRADELETITID